MQDLPTGWASIYSNHGLVSFSTSSGYRSSIHDPEGEHIVIDAASDDNALGQSLLLALEKSRVLHPNENANFYNLSRIEEDYEAFVSDLITKFGELQRRKVFSKMLHCSVSVRSGEIFIRPTKKERGESWSGSGIKEEDIFRIPLSASPGEIGAGVKMALSKCK